MKIHARVLRTAVTAIAATAILFGTAACGGDDVPSAADNTQATATPSPTPPGGATSAPTTPAPTAGGNGVGFAEDGSINWCKNVKPESFTGEAADKWGKDAVADAYCEMVTFQGENGFTNLAETKPSYRAVEFSFIKPFLTPAAQSNWDKAVALAVKDASDNDAQATIFGLSAFRMESDGLAFRGEDEPMFFNAKWSPARTYIDTTNPDRLGMDFTFQVDWNMVREATGEPVKVRQAKHLTVWLKQGGTEENTWLIDAYDFSIDKNETLPAKKS